MATAISADENTGGADCIGLLRPAFLGTLQSVAKVILYNRSTDSCANNVLSQEAWRGEVARMAYACVSLRSRYRLMCSDLCSPEAWAVANGVGNPASM